VSALTVPRRQNPIDAVGRDVSHGRPAPEWHSLAHDRALIPRCYDGRGSCLESSAMSRSGVLLSTIALAAAFGCGGRESGTHASTGASRTPTCIIDAASFDHSCTSASDCVPASFGNYCAPACFCPTGYINQSAMPQYVAALSMTPLGMDAGPDEECNCGSIGPPCCQGGLCSACGAPLPDAGSSPLLDTE
jgi:hypothetical protein